MLFSREAKARKFVKALHIHSIRFISLTIFTFHQHERVRCYGCLEYV